jgi:hypothetical protein
MSTMHEYQPYLPFDGEEVEPLSYNEFQALYGEGMKGFVIHSLAYMLQQKRPGLDDKTIKEWEADLVGTRYERKV